MKYYRIVDREGINFIVKDYYSNNKLQMSAVCTRTDTFVHNGKSTYYNKDGNIESEGIYENDKAIGTWIFTEYTSRERKYVSGFTKNELLDSIITFYYKSGKIHSTALFKNDTINGPKISYRENGSVYLKENYLNGNLNGWSVAYRKNGMKAYEEEYNKGKDTKSRKYYYRNGQLEGEIIWKKRRVNGYKIWYYRDGDIQHKTTFVNGKRTQVIRNNVPLE